MKYEETILSIVHHRTGVNPVFGEGNIIVSIVDEAAGPFLQIECENDASVPNTIFMDFDEVDSVVSIINKLKNQPSVKKALKDEDS